MSQNRVTDDSQHPHSMMLELKGEHQLLNQRLDSSIAAMAGHLSALQGDMQGVKVRLEHLAQAQSDFTHHSTAVDRLAKTIEKLVEESERRWQHHERENQDVAKTVSGHATGIKVSWALFAVIAAVLVALNGSQVRRVDERMADHLRAGEDTKRAIEARFQRNEADLRQNQAYLKQVRAP